MESFYNSRGPAAEAGVPVKLMRWPASLRLDHVTTLNGKAIQVSATGMSLVLPRSVREGEIGLVSVNAFINGNPLRLQARGSVVCCACIGMEGFRISLRFKDLDQDAANALEALLHAR